MFVFPSLAFLIEDRCQSLHSLCHRCIDTGDQSFRITGSALFFVTRGDVAQIPDEMVQKGFRPDRNRWYVERWEDQTLESASGLLAGREDEYRAAVIAALAREGARPATTAAGVVGASTVAPASGSSASSIAPLDVTWGFIQRVYRGKP